MIKSISLRSIVATVALFVAVCVSVPSISFAAPVALPKNVSVVEVPSESMSKNVPAVVVLPDAYNNQEKRFPVLYLLHGHGGNHYSWYGIRKDIQKLASHFNMIVVCPNGMNSWYWDAPKNPKMKYETFVSKELVEYMDKTYRTIANRNARAITGLSMGGHGGLWIGFRHQETFGACGSMSGGVDIRPFPHNWHMKDSLGDASVDVANWESHTVMNQLHLLKPNSIRIAFECGVADFFYEVNKRLHKELLYRNIPHDYTERPGVHNGAYWNNALPYQMMFFSNGFPQK